MTASLRPCTRQRPLSRTQRTWSGRSLRRSSSSSRRRTGSPWPTFIARVLREGPASTSGRSAEETGADLLLLNTFAKIAQDYEAITRTTRSPVSCDTSPCLSGVPWRSGRAGGQGRGPDPHRPQEQGKRVPGRLCRRTWSRTSSRSDTGQNRSHVPNDLAKGLKTGDDEKALFLQEERRPVTWP